MFFLNFIYSQFEIFANPIYGPEGDFPEMAKEVVMENSAEEGRNRSRLPQFTNEEIKLIKGDNFGSPNYTIWTYRVDSNKFLL